MVVNLHSEQPNVDEAEDEGEKKRSKREKPTFKPRPLPGEKKYRYTVYLGTGPPYH